MEQELRKFPIMCIEYCLKNFNYGYCVSIQTINNVFHFCETQAALVSLSLNLPVTEGFCTNQAKTGNEVRHHSKIKVQCNCENECKKYCLNGGKCYYLIDENTVGCNCTGFYGGKRCEKYMWLD